MSLLTKIKNKVQNTWELIRPRIFFYRYKKEWDLTLNALMDTYSCQPSPYGYEGTISLGGVYICVADYPWNYGIPREGDLFRPSRKTIVRLRNKLAEDKKNWTSANVQANLSNGILKSNSVATQGITSGTHFSGGQLPGQIFFRIGNPQEAVESEALRQKQHDEFKKKIEDISRAEIVHTKRVPDYTQVLTGWRAWQVREGRLCALGNHQNGGWEPKKSNHAVCLIKQNHIAPFISCSCGFWSFKSLETLTEVLVNYIDSVTVIGQVDIWGKVIECENGYRSEFAYPKEFWLLENDLEFIGELYGVPVRRKQ